MALTYLQQFKPAQAYEKLEIASDKPVNQISILVDESVSQTTEHENNRVQNDMVGLNPSQQAPDSSSRSPKKVAADARKQENNTFEKIDDEYPRFGPCHGVETDPETVKVAKDDAWEQVRRMTKDEDPSSIPYLYRNAIKRVEKKAQDFYGEAIVKPLKTKFRQLMLRDGCFFLQLALYILGYSEQLDYSEQHPFFGQEANEQTNMESKTRKWIKAMFFVRNQIPCVVLHELMKQSFFQKVIR